MLFRTQDWAWCSSCFFVCYLSVPLWKLPAPWLSEARIPRPTEHPGFLQDEMCSQVGSQDHQLPQFNPSLISHFRRLCWKVWWCSSGAVWKAEAGVGLVALLGTPAVLTLLSPVLLPSKASISVNSSANTLLEFKTSGGQRAPAFCSSVGMGPENFLQHLRKLVGWVWLWPVGWVFPRCGWVSTHSGSSKTPWTLLCPCYILFSKKILAVSEFCCFI